MSLKDTFTIFSSVFYKVGMFGVIILIFFFLLSLLSNIKEIQNATITLAITLIIVWILAIISNALVVFL